MLELLTKLVENHGPFAAPALILGWLIDRKATLRLAAKALRAVADVVDAAPKVVEDAKAGNVAEVVQDVRAVAPVVKEAIQAAQEVKP